MQTVRPVNRHLFKVKVTDRSIQNNMKLNLVEVAVNVIHIQRCFTVLQYLEIIAQLFKCQKLILGGKKCSLIIYMCTLCVCVCVAVILPQPPQRITSPIFSTSFIAPRTLKQSLSQLFTHMLPPSVSSRKNSQHSSFE